jgi:miniconductance mechanosensitive channel
MDDNLLTNIQALFHSAGFSENLSNTISVALVLLAIIFLSWLANYIAKNIILVIVRKIVQNTKNTWDNAFLDQRVFQRLSHLAPIVVVSLTIGYAFPGSEKTLANFDKLINVYILGVALFVVFAVLNAVNQIYNERIGTKRGTTIKGFLQVGKIVFAILFAIVVLAELFDQNVGYFLAGMGTMTAVLLLIFKDSILGLVGGIQLAGNDMVRIGDWIEMPSRNADGDVIEVSLNTVKVRNFDMTITTIPTYALIAESYRNWRGMAESGGRRISRNILIDQKSVKFCPPELLEKLKEFSLLRSYIEIRQAEIEEFNKKNNLLNDRVVNGRMLTNLGLFRKYIELYLKNHNRIHKDMMLLIRHLAPSEKGIPMQVYAFTNTIQWVEYESIQADVFDHLLAVIPFFELNVFQLPTGEDFKNLIRVP